MDLPIVAQGSPFDAERLTNSVRLPALDAGSAPIFAPEPRSLDPAKVPLRLAVKNVGKGGTMVHSLEGTKHVDVGASVEADFAMGEAAGLFGRADLVVTVAPDAGA
ncbi:MAG: hypothetical protein WDN31_05300 [Hyphomicrobium sp.]